MRGRRLGRSATFMEAALGTLMACIIVPIATEPLSAPLLFMGGPGAPSSCLQAFSRCPAGP